MTDILAEVSHLKRKLERYLEEDADVQKILKVLYRLNNVNMTLECLQETGIGKSVNSLRKRDDQLGSSARELVMKWKSIPRTEAQTQPTASSSSSNGSTSQSRVSSAPSKRRLSVSPNPLQESLDKLPRLDDDPDIASLLSDPGPSTSYLPVNHAAAAAQEEYNITSRRARTSVFSGRARPRSFAQVPRLEDLCIRVLLDNINDIQEMGPVPYNIIKPVLEACKPMQLYNLEELNPHLLEDTDELWRKHFEKEFSNVDLDEDTYREGYINQQAQREAKLKTLTAQIKQKKVEREAPVRQTMIAEASPLNRHRRAGIPVRNPHLGSSSSGSARDRIAGMSVMPAPARSRAGRGGGPSATTSGKKPAPLMQKTLKAFRNQLR